MKPKELREQNHHLRNEMLDVIRMNRGLREENENLRLRNDMLWRLALDLKEYIEEVEAEKENNHQTVER